MTMIEVVCGLLVVSALLNVWAFTWLRWLWSAALKYLAVSHFRGGKVGEPERATVMELVLARRNLMRALGWPEKRPLSAGVYVPIALRRHEKPASTLAAAKILTACIIAFALFTLCAVAAYPEDFSVPIGTRTDCGQGFSQYQIRTDIQCKRLDFACGRLRWGQAFPTSTTLGQCNASESDNAALGSCFQEIYGREMTWQDGLDIGLSTPSLANGIILDCCRRGITEGCSPDRPFVVNRDNGVIAKKVRAVKPPFRVTCEGLYANTQPCGLIEGWNCSFQFPIWWLNQAPHCLGAAAPVCGRDGCQAGETCSSCPEDCGTCPPDPPPVVNPPLRCRLIGEPIWLPGPNGTGFLENLKLECRP